MKHTSIVAKALGLLAFLALLAPSLSFAAVMPFYTAETVCGVSGDEAASSGGAQFTKSSLALGREMHASYRLAEHAPELGRFKEFRLPSGRRIDFLDASSGTIFELKPFNPRGMSAGPKQLEMYRQELITMPEFKDIDWKMVMDYY